MIIRVQTLVHRPNRFALSTILTNSALAVTAAVRTAASACQVAGKIGKATHKLAAVAGVDVHAKLTRVFHREVTHF